MHTPYFLIDQQLLESNLRTLRGVMDRTGCKILLAQKCFSCYALYPLVAKYLAGATASGIYEAKLCYDEMLLTADNHGGYASAVKPENHIFSPAFREEDMDEILRICDHIVFNTPRQLSLYGQRAKEAGLQVGLRINPECSTQEGHAIYDPCAPGSRLGTTLDEFEREVASGDQHLLRLLDGLHFHTLCEQDSDDLETTLTAVEEKFGKYLSGKTMPEGHRMRWLNFGGGHHITREGYDIPRLERCIKHVQQQYDLEVYIEPGEAVALNAGTLHASVLEVQSAASDGVRNVILDTSAACHMPDVIEMPYTPPMLIPAVCDNGQHEYRFGGPTCLSGDVIGTYRTDACLKEGDEVVFGDMAIYSMVKTNTFNGMPLPDIYIKDDGDVKLWKSFSYDDFKSRV